MSRAKEEIFDFAAQLYVSGESRRQITSIRQVYDDLWSVWAEYDLQPSPIRLFLKNGSLKDNQGNDLVEQAKAAGVIRRGRVEYDRVEAELLGVERLRELLLSEEGRDGVIYISPPGSVDEGFGVKDKHRLSFTYLYHVGNNGRIHFVAVPELEIPVTQHLDKVNKGVDGERTEGIVGVPLESPDDRGLVAYPFVAGSGEALDIVARELGYKGMLDLWTKALESKKMRGRVGDLIKRVGVRIWEAINSNDANTLRSASDVFRNMAALLVGPGLDDVDDLYSYFDSNVRALAESRKIDSLGGTTHWAYAGVNPYLADLYMRMLANPYAMDRVQGGSCPGDRGLGFEVDFLNRDNNMLVNNNVMMDVLGGDMQRENEEHYSFDHEGKCVVCHVDPKMLGPCGICEDCDHKIRSQVE